MSYKIYESKRIQFSYYDQEIQQIYNVFSGLGGTQIITQEIIPKNTRIKDFVIESPEINRSLNSINDGLRSIKDDPKLFVGNLFYFAQYGGSKTQFLNIVKDEIDENYSETVCIIFDDISQIRPHIIFEKIFAEILKKISKMQTFRENQKNYSDFFSSFNQMISNIQFSLNQSSNLIKSQEIIRELKKTKNPQYREKLTSLEELLYSTILIDPISIMNKIIELMKICTKYGFIFTFLFDEVDLWLDDNSTELQFSSKFLQRHELMKLLFQMQDSEINLFYVFACTDRVKLLFDQFSTIFTKKSPAASRLIRIFENAHKIPEPGNYGQNINDALGTLASFYTIAKSKKNISFEFFQNTDLLLKNKYQDFSRRSCNSKIINLLDKYEILRPVLAQNLKRWDKEAQKLGKLWDGFLNSILRYLNINFKRDDLPIDPEFVKTKDKIDGKFIISSLNNEVYHLFCEIKLCVKFKGDKAGQALQWLELHPTTHLVMVIFCPSPLEEINSQINQYALRQNYELTLLERFHIIHISNPYSFCAISGIEPILGKFEELAKYQEALALWLDFYGSFTNQFQKIKQDVEIDFLPSIPKTTPGSDQNEVLVNPGNIDSDSSFTSLNSMGSQSEMKSNGHHIQPIEGAFTQIKNRDSISENEVSLGTSETKQNSRPSSSQSSIDFSNDEKTSISLLMTLFYAKKFTKSGRISKSTIENLVHDKSLGLTDLDRYYEVLKKNGIVSTITEKTVTFLKDFKTIDNDNDFKRHIVRAFEKSRSKNHFQSYF